MRENVVFIALACGQQPDHSTIATFVSSMKAEILPLFRDILFVCQEMDLLGGTFFALPSNASKEWSSIRSELQRKKERLEAKVQELLAEHVQEDNRDDPPPGPGGGRDRERLEKWLKENKSRHGTTGKEISSNVTDNDSAKMKTAHGVIQGYNRQALIDAKHLTCLPKQFLGGQLLSVLVNHAKLVCFLGRTLRCLEQQMVGKFLVGDLLNGHRYLLFLRKNR